MEKIIKKMKTKISENPQTNKWRSVCLPRKSIKKKNNNNK